MTRNFRTFAIAISLCAAAAATTVYAQSTNPTARGERGSFYYGPVQGGQGAAPSPGLTPEIGNGFGRGNIGKAPGPGGPVTPVPEPSQWALMLAGLALVGFIVRRSSKRNP